MSDTPLTDLKLIEALQLYENGKHRRYTLLFSVNGGAFAIAKLLTGSTSANVLGALTLTQLALGMALFTAVMVWDIFAFGEKMRRTWLKGSFGPQGKAVLLLTASLIIAGWLLAGFG